MRTALLALALFLPAAAWAASEPCGIAPLTAEFTALDQLPQPVKTLLYYKLRRPVPGMAARGEPFNATDVVSPGNNLPARRLIAAGMRGERGFLWYEHGGVAHHEHLVLFDAQGSDAHLMANITGGFKNDFCARARDFLAGAAVEKLTIEGEW